MLGTDEHVEFLEENQDVVEAIYDTLDGKETVDVRKHWLEVGDSLLENTSLPRRYGMGSIDIVLHHLSEGYEGVKRIENSGNFPAYEVGDISDFKPSGLL